MSRNKGYTLRKFFNDIHLWLGLTSGLVLFVVCLTGTIYTFHKEIEELVEPQKFSVEVPANATRISTGALVAMVEKELNGAVTAIQIPADPEATYRLTVKQSAPKGVDAANGKGGRGKVYFVNPYTGALTGEDGGPTKEFFITVMKLHRWLLIEGDTGKIIVGVSTIIFVFLTLTGLILWFPARIKNWKQGLKIKTKANWKRINHDLHNTLGFYSFILLLIMGLTGLCWSFEWYRDGVSEVMGAKVFAGRGEKPLPSTDAGELQPISIDQAVTIAESTFPYEGNLSLSLPQGKEGTFVATKNKTGFFAGSASDKMQIHQYSGTPLKIDRFADKKLNEQIVASIKPLHLGEIYGTFSKILYFIACLIATSLPVTGTMIWINKLRKKPGKRRTAPAGNGAAPKAKGTEKLTGPALVH